MPISGFHGVLAGFLVGIKQIVPDQELSVIGIKAKTSYQSIFHRMFCGRFDISNDGKDYEMGGFPLPGSDTFEASRRRKRGARALEERLATEKLPVATSAGGSHIDASEEI